MTEIAGPVPFRARGFAPRAVPLAGAATLIGLVLLWQLGATEGFISTQFLPTPSAIGRALIQLVGAGSCGVSLGRR